MRDGRQTGFNGVTPFQTWIDGEIGKGILFMIVQAINFCLIFVAVGFLTFPAFWLYGIWDAKTTAEKMAAKTVA